MHGNYWNRSWCSYKDMRQRIFELRSPSRLMSKDRDEALLSLVDEARNAPNALAFFKSLAVCALYQNCAAAQALSRF